MAQYNTEMEKLQLCPGLTDKIAQCYNFYTEELRGSIFLWIIEWHTGNENSFAVRLTSSGLDSGVDGPGITWGVYAIDSMDASACANAHCPRLRAEARGEWHSLPMCQPSTRKLSVISRYCFVCAKCTDAAKRWMAVQGDSV